MIWVYIPVTAMDRASKIHQSLHIHMSTGSSLILMDSLFWLFFFFFKDNILVAWSINSILLKFLSQHSVAMKYRIGPITLVY